MSIVGEYRVGVSFNPSNDVRVDDVKRSTAYLIDGMIQLADASDDPEIKRVAHVAATYYETAAMWAVKAVTKKPRE